MAILGIIWFVVAAAGVMAAATALVARGVRQRLLVVAGSCFAVAGLLGILSIGLLFLLLSVACFAAARSPAVL